MNDDMNMNYSDNNNNNSRKVVVIKKKGRGHKDHRDRYTANIGNYESLKNDENDGDAQKSVEGYIVIATNIHEEASEADVYDLFADYGQPLQTHLNLDRRTGYVKGYALIEYATYDEAKDCVDNLNGSELYEQTIAVDFAFRS